MKTTARGFELIEFLDCYDKPCSLQQSSLAIYATPGTSAIWLGQGDYRMHLEEDQVEALITHLQRWLDDGSFRPATSPAPEVGELVELLQQEAGCYDPRTDVRATQFTRAATLLQQLSAPALAAVPVPVSVSERLPGEGDCNAEGGVGVTLLGKILMAC